MSREPGEEPWVGLADAVSGVRAELEAAMESAQHSKLKFEVGSVEMEFAVDIREDKHSTGGVNVRVLNLGRTKSAGHIDVHRLKIVLQPREAGTGEPVNISDHEPDLPLR